MSLFRQIKGCLPWSIPYTFVALIPLALHFPPLQWVLISNLGNHGTDRTLTFATLASMVSIFSHSRRCTNHKMRLLSTLVAYLTTVVLTDWDCNIMFHSYCTLAVSAFVYSIVASKLTSSHQRIAFPAWRLLVSCMAAAHLQISMRSFLNSFQPWETDWSIVPIEALFLQASALDMIATYRIETMAITKFAISTILCVISLFYPTVCISITILSLTLVGEVLATIVKLAMRQNRVGCVCITT